MEKLSILYDQNIDFNEIMDYAYLEARKNNLRTYSMAWKTTLLLVDHLKRNTYLYNNNPCCLQLFGGRLSQDAVADNFIESFICRGDEQLFATIITAIKDAMRNDFMKGDKYYYFSFDMSLQGPKRKRGLYSFTVFPYLYTPDDKTWITGYQVAASTLTAPGNLRLCSVREGSNFRFDMESGCFRQEDPAWKLSPREKTILTMSAEGFTEQQISDFLKINTGMLKNEKGKIFEKMNVNTIYAAISRAFKSGDL